MTQEELCNWSTSRASRAPALRAWLFGGFIAWPCRVCLRGGSEQCSEWGTGGVSVSGIGISPVHLLNTGNLSCGVAVSHAANIVGARTWASLHVGEFLRGLMLSSQLSCNRSSCEAKLLLGSSLVLKERQTAEQVTCRVEGSYKALVATVTLSCKYELKKVAVPLNALCGVCSHLGSAGLSPGTLLMEQVMELCCDLPPRDTLIGAGSLCLSLLTAQLLALMCSLGSHP